VELSSDSDVELIECPPRVRRPAVKRRKILDPRSIANVPVYSGRVSKTLTLYQENPDQVDREIQKQVALSDSEDEEEGDSDPESRHRRKRRRRSAHSGLGLSDSEDEVDFDQSLSTSRRDGSPSPPSSPTLPTMQTRRVFKAIRDADRNLRGLEVFRASPKKGRNLCESDDVVVIGVIPAAPREITLKVRCREHIYRVPMKM
uniref:NFATC2-interacting protein-like n=1 Tax=Pristiophorus japonicus TaxID=55135 RepID=UPI00398EA219